MSPSVLIVGAGPVGLMAAFLLKKHGIACRIIDRREKPAHGSNATWIQPRTLEFLEAYGLIESFLKAGRPCYAINLYEGESRLARIDFARLQTAFPFVLMLAQSETEALLIDALHQLGVSVERGVSLVDLQETLHQAEVVLQLADGTKETVLTDWLLACDGAMSAVRAKLKLDFSGEALAEQFMVADATMSSFLAPNEMHLFINRGTIFKEKYEMCCVSSFGSKHYRIHANLYQSAKRQQFHPHEVKEVIAERTAGNFIVEQVSWISPFWIYGKTLKTLRVGSVFLLGDTAHVHSPLSGQGMNMGLQDAINLAWKLALVIQKRAHATLLDTYEKERLPVIQSIVAHSDAMTKHMLFDPAFFDLMDALSKHQIEDQKIDHVLNEISQLSIAYADHPASRVALPGMRAPDVRLSKPTSLYQKLQALTYHVLCFYDPNQSKGTLSQLSQFISETQKMWRELLTVHVVSPVALKDFSSVILDEKRVIFDHYAGPDIAVSVIRPDFYIGCVLEKWDLSSLNHFLKQHLI